MRINDRINAQEVRLISSTGDQVDDIEEQLSHIDPPTEEDLKEDLTIANPFFPRSSHINFISKRVCSIWI